VILAANIIVAFVAVIVILALIVSMLSVWAYILAITLIVGLAVIAAVGFLMDWRDD
jgi:hypothetical protein